MNNEPAPVHQDLTNAFQALQTRFGKTPSPAAGNGCLRLRFEGIDLEGKELADILTESGAKVDVRVKTPAIQGVEDMLIGNLEGMAFMANGIASDKGYSFDIRIYAPKSKQAMVGADALFSMMDGLLQAHPIPPDALPGYLAYCLQRAKPKEARKLAAELSAIVAEFLAR